MEYQDTRDALNGTQGRSQCSKLPKICYVRNAFSCEKGRYEAFFEDEQAWVWDNTAGHYTSCHSLTDNQVRYVKSRAFRG